MNRDFLKSNANAFVRSRAFERDASRECQRVGFINGVLRIVNGMATQLGYIGSFDTFDNYPAVGGIGSFPKQNYWKLRITANVTAPPANGAVWLRIFSWQWRVGFEGPWGSSYSTQEDADRRYLTHFDYYDDGLEFLTEETQNRNLSFGPPGSSPGSGYNYRPRRTTTPLLVLPSSPGQYVYNFKIRSRPFCHTWFSAYPVNSTQLSPYEYDGYQRVIFPGFAVQPAGGQHNIFMELLRVFTMQVGYTVNALQTTVGTPVQFTDITVTDTPKTNWLWNFGDGNTSTLQHPQKSWAAPGNYPVTLAITDTSGETYQTTGTAIRTIKVV